MEEIKDKLTWILKIFLSYEEDSGMINYIITVIRHIDESTEIDYWYDRNYAFIVIDHYMIDPSNFNEVLDNMGEGYL